MIDLRIYRAALLPALASVVVLMFSLQPAPEPIEPPVSTADFDGDGAARLARSIVATAPTRRPGSEGDTATTVLVRQRFEAIEGGEVAVQSYESSFEGDDVDLQNVVLTLPGESEEVLLILANRDAALGAGATTSAASTAALITLAEDLGASRRNRTIVLASTGGGSEGATGARELVSELVAPEGYAAAIALAQMGVAEVHAPVVVAPEPDGDSPPAKLIETAAALAEPRFGPGAVREGGFDQLARLAIPVGLGEGAALADEGVEGVTITGNGERLLAASDDQPAGISSETLEQIGGLALDLALSVDEAPQAAITDDAPSTYIQTGTNLIPGWTLVLLGGALIAPGLLAALDGWFRLRSRQRALARKTIPWVLERVLIALVPLVLLYTLALFGLAPDPRFPYEPDRFPLDLGGFAVLLALGIAAALATLLVRPMRTPLDAEAGILASAGGILTGVSLVGIWALNPYLGLLLSPLAHVWLLAARGEGAPRMSLVGGFGALALVPVAVAAVLVASQLEFGLSLPWQLLLLCTSGAIGPGMALLWCGVVGGALSTLAAARRDQRPSVASGTARRISMASR